MGLDALWAISGLAGQDCPMATGVTYQGCRAGLRAAGFLFSPYRVYLAFTCASDFLVTALYTSYHAEAS